MLLRTPIDVGFAIRDRRRRLRLDQVELAQRVGASRKWVVEVEKGKPRAEIGLLLRTLDALGLRLSLDADETATAAGADVPAVDLDRLLDRARNKRK
jgi:HTH-type transcriptional regulator/antitoxin HipB